MTNLYIIYYCLRSRTDAIKKPSRNSFLFQTVSNVFEKGFVRTKLNWHSSLPRPSLSRSCCCSSHSPATHARVDVSPFFIALAQWPTSDNPVIRSKRTRQTCLTSHTVSVSHPTLSIRTWKQFGAFPTPCSEMQWMVSFITFKNSLPGNAFYDTTYCFRIRSTVSFCCRWPMALYSGLLSQALYLAIHRALLLWFCFLRFYLTSCSSLVTSTVNQAVAQYPSLQPSGSCTVWGRVWLLILSFLFRQWFLVWRPFPWFFYFFLLPF